MAVEVQEKEDGVVLEILLVLGGLGVGELEAQLPTFRDCVVARKVLGENGTGQQVGLGVLGRRGNAEALVVVEPEDVEPASAPLQVVEEALHGVDCMEQLESICGRLANGSSRSSRHGRRAAFSRMRGAITN